MIWLLGNKIIIGYKCRSRQVVKKEIIDAYGKNPETSLDFPRIINQKNWNRLTEMLKGESILAGGKSNIQDYYLAPTLLDEPSLDSLVMKDEIFGPVLAYVCRIEWQARGMPHAHMLFILRDKVMSPRHIDAIISAELPDPGLTVTRRRFSQ